MKGIQHTSTGIHYRKEVNKIVNIVAAKYSIPASIIYKYDRHLPYVIARQMVWKIARYLYGNAISFDALGRMFGRSHATILQGIRSISDQIDTNRIISKDYVDCVRIARIKLNKKIDPPNKDLILNLEKVLYSSSLISAKISIREILKSLKN